MVIYVYFFGISYKYINIASDEDWLKNFQEGLKNISGRLETRPRHPPFTPKKNPHVVRVWDCNVPIPTYWSETFRWCNAVITRRV